LGGSKCSRSKKFTSKKMTLLGSIFQFKCPNCREGSLFVNSNPYRLRDLNKMHERCSKCNLKFSLEPGFYQGAAYVSYGFQVLNSLIVFNLIFWFTTIHWKDIIYFILVFIIILTPYIVVVSRSVWIHMFVKHNSKKF